MSFASDYNKLRKKRLEEEKKASSNDIAPVYTSVPTGTVRPVKYGESLPVSLEDANSARVELEYQNKQKEAEEEAEGATERTWFQAGAFDDGYQFGDATKTFAGTANDLTTDLTAGVLGIGEGFMDFLLTVWGGLAEALGAKTAADWVKDFVARDTIDEQAIAKGIIGATNPYEISTRIAEQISGVDFGNDIEKDSLLGDKTDSLVQSGGQLLGTIGLQAAGVPWWLTSGTTSFGSTAEGAFKEGASYGEAIASGVISAGAEILTEKLFGGSGLGEKGLINLEPLTKGISSKVVKALADLGVDMAAEGAEEVVASVASRLGSSLYKEESIGELLTSEEAFDEYLESFIGGSVLGGVANVGKTASSIKTGRDYRTGLTENEQKVVDKVYEDRIAEAEKDGKKLTSKEKAEIHDSVLNELKKGYIGIDTIESVLGGESYKSYQDAVATEEALQKEYDTLYKMKNGEKSDEQIDRQAELKKQLEELKANDTKGGLKAKLSDEVYNSLTRQVGKRTQTDGYLLESYNEKARRKQKFNADVNQYKGKAKESIQNIINKGQMQNTNRAHDVVDFAVRSAADRGYTVTTTTTNEILEKARQMYGEEYVRENFYEYNEKTKEWELTTIPNAEIDSDGKVIALNVDSPNLARGVIGHEIGHTLEKSKHYGDLKDLLFELESKKKGEKAFAARKQNTEQKYKNIKGANADFELTNDLIGEYIYTADPEFVKSLYTKNSGLFQTIWDRIKYLYKMATAGSAEQRDLLRIENQFAKVYRDAQKMEKKSAKNETKGEPQGSVQYALSKDVDGNVFVDVAEDIFDENSGESVARTIQRVIHERFNNLIDVHGQKIQINKTTNDEFRRSKSANSLLEDAPQAYDDKLKTIANADEILSAAKNWIGEEIKHTRTDDIVEFARGNVMYRVGENGYVADVIVGTRKNGSAVLYDLVNIYDKKITEAPVTMASYKNSQRRQDASVVDIVPQPEENVNTHFSLSDSDGKKLTREQSEYFKNSKMRDDDGNLKVMYHGSQDAGFHIFDSSMSDDDMSFFFVDRNDVAASYSGTSETYEAQTIHTAEDMNNFIESIGVEGYEVVEKDGKFTLLYEGDRVADSNTAQGIYDEFCWYEGVGEGDANYKVYLNLTNPLVVDAEGRNWNNVTREYSQEIADRYNSLTADERAALTNLASWEEISIFRDEIRQALADTETGAKGSYDEVFAWNIRRAYEKLGGNRVNMYDLFTIASENFSEDSIKQFAVKQMNTRDYAQKAKSEGYDGVIFKNIVDVGGYGNGSEGASTVAVAFDSNQIKSVANEKPTGDADIRYSLSKDSEGRELSPAVKKRFANSKAVDEDGNLKVVYHGTASGEFTIFDKSKGSVEGDFGSGFYFTDNEYDVTNNYEGGGPDFDNKVSRRAVEIYSNDEDITYEEAEKKARAELYKGGHKFEVYLNIENPAIVGETILFDPDSYYSEYNQEDYDSEDDYYGDVEQLIADDIDGIIWDIENKVDVYKTDGIAEVLWTAFNEGGVDLEKLKKRLSSLYLEDSNGNFVDNEVARQIVESLGYDGIIDSTVSDKWRNMDMEAGTTHYIVFKPNQIKAVTNVNPTDNPDIRFSLSKAVEETKGLLAVHNLKANELLKSLDLGGLPMPSIAVIKSDAGHDQYGEISLIMPKEAIDPQANRDNKVYGGDAWTPTYPRMEYKANEAVAKRVRDKYYELERKYDYGTVRPLYDYVYELENALNRNGGEEGLKEELYDNTKLMQVYLLDSGKGAIPTVQKEIRTELTDHEVGMYEFLAQRLGNEVIDGVSYTGLGSLVEHRKAYWATHGDAIKAAYGEFLANEFGFSEEQVQNVLSNTTTAALLNVVRGAKRYQTNGRVTIKTEDDYQATQKAIREAAGEGYKAWVDDLFGGSEEKSGIRNNIDTYTPSGNRRSWDALHWENTLENVVEAMKRQDRTGSEAVFGVHKFFATASKEYGSIAEIKADSDRLHKIDDGEYQAAKNAFERRLSDIATRIMDKGESNPFIAMDNAMECIVDAVRDSKTQAGIYKELSQYKHLNVTKQDVADIVSLVNDIGNMPTGYFEAKPMRAVGFDEVGVFVIPRNADVKLKQELLNRGYAIAEYDPDIEGDRQKVLNSFEKYKFSLSDVNEQITPTANDVPLRDLRLETQEDIAPVEETTISEAEQVAPENIEAVTDVDEPSESIAPQIPEKVAKPKQRKPSKASLVRYTKKQTSNYRNLQGAYNVDGKQYLSDGMFVAEFNNIDESIPHNKDFPIKKLETILNTAVEGRFAERYSIDLDKIIEINKANKDNKDKATIVMVGGTPFDSKYIEAVMRAVSNPTFALSEYYGGIKPLVTVGDNGKVMLMPLRTGNNPVVAYEAQPITDAPEAIAPTTADDATAAREASMSSLDEVSAPAEVEAPYFGETEDAPPSDPFENRDVKAVGNRKVKAYMYENPEVKPFFQQEANIMLGELRDSQKGEKFYTSTPDGRAGVYGAESYGVWTGVSRETTPDIAYLLDDGGNGRGYTYAEIEAGLKAIIEDNGAENNACSKRIEFLLNERLMNGYQTTGGYDVPANQDYINLLQEKQIIKQLEEDRNAFFEVADDYAPVVEESTPAVENIQAPVAEDKAYEAIRPKRESKEPKMARVKEGEDIAPTSKVAEVLTEEPETAKKKRAWSKFVELFGDKQAVFERLSLKTKNRELMAKADFLHRSEARAQRFIGKGADGVKALNDVRAEVERSGKTELFYKYMYHALNVDRMTLAERYDIPNKAVFGDSVTTEASKQAVAELEAKNPQFKKWAKELYDITAHQRKQLVNDGVISQETADLWAEMYPHYVPIRRVGDSGLNINVPLDTGRTGINAPIKRATGGSSDILPLFDTMAMRIEQTYKAGAKNSFGLELKDTLGTTIEKNTASLDEVIDSVDNHEELLKKGENGANPTFTVFENGERVTFEITEEMYDALKPAEGILGKTSKTLNTINNVRRGLITEYNPVFLATNAIKDAQDILINSQHAARTYANIPNAIIDMASGGKWYQEYMENGGESNTYFDGEKKTFSKEDKGIKKIIGMPLRAISAANNFVERAPRLAEYIASRKAGASVEVAMLDAARVTTNFAAGGDVTKFLNRNGATFLNASVQGAMQQVRNVREAKANGLKGWVQLAAKTAAVGIPALILNNLLWDDDEEYEELSDYVKDNYYIVAKYGDGQFVRIPKGRAVAVIQEAFEQVSNALTGDDEVDLANFLELAVSNLAPNNPIDNNIISPIAQAITNKTWYGEDLVPTSMQDLPAAEQYDESTDAISKWLGEKLNISPMKLNYLLDQYSGGVGDVFLPMLTPEAERGDDTLLGNIVAPFKDKFTTDSVLNNQNVSDFYATRDELTVNANGRGATDEDILKSKYINSVSAELSELYKLKREVQNSNLSDARKYEKVRDIQDEINAIARESLNAYNDVYIDDGYAVIGDREYRLNDKGEWQKISDKQADKQDDVISDLGISESDYWSNKSEYDFAYEYPEKYAVAKSVGGYESYKTYNSELYDIKADKDEYGKTIRGSRKEKVAEYINNLDADYGVKIILFKSEYKADDTYNSDIVEYLNSREDISYEEMVSILTELGFTVKDGTVYWD